MFVSCGCATVDAVSDAGGIASSGPSTAPAETGTVLVHAGTVDPLTPRVTYQVAVALPPPTTTTTLTPTTTATTSAPPPTSSVPVVAPAAQPVAVEPRLTG